MTEIMRCFKLSTNKTHDTHSHPPFTGPTDDVNSPGDMPTVSGSFLRTPLVLQLPPLRVRSRRGLAPVCVNVDASAALLQCLQPLFCVASPSRNRGGLCCFWGWVVASKLVLGLAGDLEVSFAPRGTGDAAVQRLEKWEYATAQKKDQQGVGPAQQPCKEDEHAAGHKDRDNVALAQQPCKEDDHAAGHTDRDNVAPAQQPCNDDEHAAAHKDQQGVALA
eukprot:1206424-Prymnesium_polylepis.1